MLECSRYIYRRQLGGRLTPEGTATCRELQMRHFASVTASPQTLMHCTVLTIHGNDLGTCDFTQWLNYRPSSNETLFVGQRQSLARPQGRNRDGETSEPDDGIDDNLGFTDDVGDIAHETRVRKLCGKSQANGIIDHCHHSRPVLLNLRAQDGFI